MDKESQNQKIIREAIVEGIFYPADRPELLSAIQSFLSQSTVIPGKARLIVSPHGSFDFSGAIMADAFKSCAALSPRNIIVIGSCYHIDEPFAYIPESSVFRTPLGDSQVDALLLESILDSSSAIIQNDLPHLQEHTIELQLPFMQYLFPRHSFLPILIGNGSEIVFKSLINALSLVLSEDFQDTLIIISSNLSSVQDRAQAHREAELALDLVLGGRGQELLELSLRHEVSSENAAVLALAAHFAAMNEMTVIARSSSLPVHYDPSNVVEYAALALY